MQNYINSFAHLPFPPERFTEVAQKVLEHCSSDAYVFVDQPGVTLDDLADYSDFKFLRTYAFMSSTLGAIPRAEEPLNFESLIKFVSGRCEPVSFVEIEGFEEVETYIDSGRRVISIKFPELPPKDQPELRKESLKAADEALRSTLRKLPSPYHTVIYSTSIAPPYLNRINEKRYAQMGIFPDISKDTSRQSEFERNNKVTEEEHKLPEKRTNLEKDDDWKYSIRKFIDADLVVDNEWLVLAIALTALVFIMKVSLDVLSWIWNFLFKQEEKKKEASKRKNK